MAGILIGAVALASSSWLFQFMHQFADPSGANGYFYLKQTESLAAGHGFYFKDRSLAFAIIVFFMWLTGQALLSFQLAIAFVWFWLLAALGWLTWNLSRSAAPLLRLAAVAAVLACAVCSSPLYEFAMTFFKNFTAVVFILVAMAGWSSSWRRHARTAWAILFVVAALLTHKSMALIVACFVVPWLVGRADWRGRLLGALGLLGVVGLFLWQFERGSNYLRAIAGSFIEPKPWWIWFSALPGGNKEMLASMVALFLMLGYAIAIRSRVSGRQRVILDGIVLIGLVGLQPFQTPGANGPGYRVLLMGPILALPLLGIFIRERWIFASAIVLLLFFAQPFMVTRHLDDVFTPWDVLREQVMQIKNFVRPEDHLTSHHGLEFFIDEATGIRSRSFLSDHPEKKNFRVAYVAQRWLPSHQVQEALRDRALLEIGSDYVLLRESDWQELRLIFSLPRSWRNPDRHRPDYIYE